MTARETGRQTAEKMLALGRPISPELLQGLQEEAQQDSDLGMRDYSQGFLEALAEAGVVQEVGR